MSPRSVLSALQKVWFITGTSSGLGRELALAALARGDKVVASARSVSRITELEKGHPDACRAVQLDVTDDFSVLKEKAADAVRAWGRVDVLVNNAGAGKLGFSEEVGVEGYETQFRTNFFGQMNVTHAFLPYMRARREGTIVFIGSRSSWRANVPMLGTYNASKAALSAAAEALGAEVAPVGIRVLNVIPGGLRTKNWDNMQLLPTTPNVSDTTNEGIKDYDPVRNQLLAWMKAQNGKQPGNPVASARAIVDVVHGDVSGPPASEPSDETFSGEVPREAKSSRGWPDLGLLVLGSDAEQNIREKCERVMRNLDEWKDVVRSIDFKD